MRFIKKRRPRGATALRPRSASSASRRQVLWKPVLRWGGVLCVLGGVGWGLWVGGRKLQDPHAFPLRQVHFVGELRNLAEADLRPIAHGVLGQNFFMANLDALRDALAANPWVERVKVRRWWPDVVEIELRERVAFGYWGAEDSGEMVDVQGRRFRPTVVRQPGPWPRIAGPAGHEQTLIKTYDEVRSLFEPLGLQLTELRQDDRRAWWLTFANGLQIHVGRHSFMPRLHRLVQLYPRVFAAQIDRIAVVDLRYGNGFAVRWKPGASPMPTAG